MLSYAATPAVVAVIAIVIVDALVAGPWADVTKTAGRGVVCHQPTYSSESDVGCWTDDREASGSAMENAICRMSYHVCRLGDTEIRGARSLVRGVGMLSDAFAAHKQSNLRLQGAALYEMSMAGPCSPFIVRNGSAPRGPWGPPSSLFAVSRAPCRERVAHVQ